MQNEDVGKKVTVWIKGYRKSITRVLQEDHIGLFVKNKGEIMRVVPKLDWEYKETGTYIDKEFYELATRGSRPFF